MNLDVQQSIHVHIKYVMQTFAEPTYQKSMKINKCTPVCIDIMNKNNVILL